MSLQLQAGLAGLRRRWPNANIKARGDGRLPWTLDAVVPAPSVRRLAGEPNVVYVRVEKVRGVRKRRPKRKPSFFCVWGSVAIQVEGRARGRVDVEDRHVLVKALTPEDAKRRLAKEWQQYASPYLNSFGELVRWQLIEVLDVYELFEDEVDPKGTEVYSRIRSRAMKPAYVWKPGRKVS